MKILFSGGGTLGPVTPLLAIRESVLKKYPDADFVWIGTHSGPERKLMEDVGIRFETLVSGKLRRYISLWNIVDMVKIVIAFFQSFTILLKEKPDMCISAGGYISVPLHWAAYFLRIPMWIHQQDIKVGLANKLMTPCARIITTAVKDVVKHFPQKKTHWLGNPVREEVFLGSKAEASKLFSLTRRIPVVFVMGGGTGSLKINQMIVEAMEHIHEDVQVIHLSGQERPQELVNRAVSLYETYHVFQFFTHEMKHAYAVADMVVTRGGFGSLTELAALGKPAIIIPKPGHQEDNVKKLEQADAAILIDQHTGNGLKLAGIIKELLADEGKRDKLGKHLSETLPRAKEEDILKIVEELVNPASFTGRDPVL